eukprot:jgi/Psemu1/299452/fgenesh1_pm.1526_\
MIDWSPFYCLPKAELTPAGLLQLDTADHETLLLRRSGVEFRHDGPTPMAPRPRGLAPSEHWKNRTGFETVLILTTHRFVLLHTPQQQQRDNDNSNDNTAAAASSDSLVTDDARFVHLSNVRGISASGGPSLMSPNCSYKIVLQTQTYDNLVLVFKNRMGLGTSRSDRDQSFRELSKALERKRWEVAARLEEKRVKEASRFSNLGSSGHKVGLDRILAKNQARHQQNARLAEEALSGDSDTLLGEAAELLKVIQKYTVLVQKFEGSNNSNNSNDAEEEAAAKLKGLLSDMGMTSALSQSKLSSTGGGGGGKSLGFARKRSAEAERSEYHELTARQVTDFLVPRLKATTTGMMGLGLSLRTFPSGIRVLQLDALALVEDNASVRSKFLELCSSGSNGSGDGDGGSTALEASHVLGLSPLLASEQLEEAERLGWLCRDVTLSTVRFYPNKFATGF